MLSAFIKSHSYELILFIQSIIFFLFGMRLFEIFFGKQQSLNEASHQRRRQKFYKMGHDLKMEQSLGGWGKSPKPLISWGKI